MSSMTIEFLALLAQTIYWADYALTGKDKLNWKNLGKLLIWAIYAKHDTKCENSCVTVLYWSDSA